MTTPDPAQVDVAEFHCDVCGSDSHATGICEDQPVRVSCIHMPGCDCAAIKARLEAAEAKVAAVEALADEWDDDLDRPRSMHRFAAAQRLRAALEQTP